MLGTHQIASTRADPDDGWEDFFEAALLDNIEDERELAEEEEENGSASSSDDYLSRLPSTSHVRLGNICILYHIIR
jgi:hypothetical protein